jgi:hypothetical protein
MDADTVQTEEMAVTSYVLSSLQRYGSLLELSSPSLERRSSPENITATESREDPLELKCDDYQRNQSKSG